MGGVDAAASPPLSGRPFIEALYGLACQGEQGEVAAPERAALHRGVIGSDPPAEGQSRRP